MFCHEHKDHQSRHSSSWKTRQAFWKQMVGWIRFNWYLQGYHWFFFLIDWEIACLFLLEWEFQTQQNKHKKLLGDADHKITTWDRNSVSCFYCTDSAQVERALLTGVTQFDRHHIENGFLSYHRQRKYILLFQERATRRGVMIFLSISDQLLGPCKCCYTDSVG